MISGSARYLIVVFTWSVLSAADFTAPVDTQDTTGNPLPTAQQSVARFQLPPGFSATVFASEPQVRQPIGMTFDGRGRLWVAENYTYAQGKRIFDRSLNDRIVILNDTDGDGRSDTTVVFQDRLKQLTSVALGFGGVFALCPPNLVFIRDADGDDRPDSEPQVLLDGFDNDLVGHNIANGLKWGPDGWLYGRHGIQATSTVGLPGAASEQRVKLNAAIWRYHPTSKVFEVVVDGTTNPWGMDWDEHGEAFFINTVIGHLWHLIPGAHYRRMFGEDLDPKIYQPIEQHADHVHWATGETWNSLKDAGKVSGGTSAAGGGHAHCGLMIYQGDNWPADYRGKLFTINFHGRRLNQEILERDGSGYVGRRASDLLQSDDTWFRGIDLASGPDGGVYLLDWSDIGECHERDGIHRNSGRIYKIVNGVPGPILPLTPALDAAAVMMWLTHPNVWFERQVRQFIQQRPSLSDVNAIRQGLKALLTVNERTTLRLRALWALHALQECSEEFLLPLLTDRDDNVRVWSIRLLTDAMPISRRATKPAVTTISAGLRDGLVRLAGKESAASVRLALASALQRLPLAERATMAKPLLAHGEDATDHNLPLMLWYGIKDLATAAPDQLAALATETQIPLIRRLSTRRLAELSPPAPALEALLASARTKDGSFGVDVLVGLSDAYKGVRKAVKPAAWDSFAATFTANGDTNHARQVRELSTLFGDGRALDDSKRIARDTTVPLSQRRAALQTLIDNRPDDLRPVCEKMLTDREMNDLAARGLGLFDDSAVGKLLAERYVSHFRPDMRPEVMAVLVSRPSFARAMLVQIGDEKNHIPRTDVTPFHARQIRSFKDKDLNQLLADKWGSVRDSSEDKVALMATLRKQLTPEVLAQADQRQGRQLFAARCSACHTLYDQGGRIGPDLTGAGRHELTYVLDNVIDPSAVVAADYRLAVVTLKDGRVLQGLIPERSERTITLQTMTERLTIEQSEIIETLQMNSSLMPEGLLHNLTEIQVRDLVAYLMSNGQVPLPE